MRVPKGLIEDAISVIQRRFGKARDGKPEEYAISRANAQKLEAALGTQLTLRVLRGAGFARSGGGSWATSRRSPPGQSLTPLKPPFEELLAVKDQWLGRRSLGV